MKLRLSVQARLTLLFCLASCCGFLLLGTISYAGLRTNSMRVVDDDLKSRRDGVEDFLSEHIASVPSPKFQALLTQRAALKPAYLVVQLSSGQLIYCGTAVRSMCSDPITPQAHFFTAEGLRVLTSMGTVDDVAYRFAVMSDLSFENTVLHDLFFLLLFIIPAAITSSTLGGHWLIGRTLRPVRSLIEDVHAIGEQNLSQRLKVPKTGDEVQLLSETLNGMLCRIDRAFQQVKEITANASHELRTPVSIIRTAAEVALLNARPTVTSHADALRQICTEAERNTRLLDSMLSLARIDSGRQEPHFIWLDLEHSVWQALESCRSLADSKDIQIVFEKDPGSVQVWGDPGHLNRLWLLLLDNAIKYTPNAGNIRVLLKWSSTSEPVCEISDNGIGIPSGDLPSIFERFYRSENARLTGAPGSGLGLAIARWIVDSHHAKIDLQSTPEHGTTFRVSFSAFTFVSETVI
jgi:signal transduction histidine kinase